ncbi:MAG: hypothetical protein ACPGRD_04925, partial [Planktomarina sp.]
GGRSTDRQPDFLNGGKGDDTLMAYNNDIMNGGEGEDVFVTEPKNESVPVIQDFIAGEDLIVVIAEDLPENSAVAVETDENGTSSIFANDMLVAFAHGPIPPTQEDVVIDLAAKFPPALCDVLGVRSLALEGNFSHRVSSEEFQRRHV